MREGNSNVNNPAQKVQQTKEDKNMRYFEDDVSWKELIDEVLQGINEPLIACTLSEEEELNQKFDSSWGGVEGTPFTAWTENWVLFPAVYDGSEWVAKVPRNPCHLKTKHIGG